MPREPQVADGRARTLAIAIDGSGRVHYGKDDVGGGHAAAVLGRRCRSLPRPSSGGQRVLRLHRIKGRRSKRATTQIAEVFGVRRLLPEGGGALNGSFLKVRLIDEFSTLIDPGVDRLAGVQSIVDYHRAEGERPSEGRALRLIAWETLEGGMVWLRHAVESAPRDAAS